MEIKYQHTSDAWWQVEHLYLPVLRWAFPPDLWSFARVEVVKWYDPAVAFPERVSLIPHVDKAFGAPGWPVHILKP